jgi:hypothetical protein
MLPKKVVPKSIRQNEFALLGFVYVFLAGRNLAREPRVCEEFAGGRTVNGTCVDVTVSKKFAPTVSHGFKQLR